MTERNGTATGSTATGSTAIATATTAGATRIERRGGGATRIAGRVRPAMARTSREARRLQRRARVSSAIVMLAREAWNG